jgi:hypothetical protein
VKGTRSTRAREAMVVQGHCTSLHCTVGQPGLPIKWPRVSAVAISGKRLSVPRLRAGSLVCGCRHAIHVAVVALQELGEGCLFFLCFYEKGKTPHCMHIQLVPPFPQTVSVSLLSWTHRRHARSCDKPPTSAASARCKPAWLAGSPVHRYIHIDTRTMHGWMGPWSSPTNACTPLPVASAAVQWIANRLDKPSECSQLEGM